MDSSTNKQEFELSEGTRNDLKNLFREVWNEVKEEFKQEIKDEIRKELDKKFEEFKKDLDDRFIRLERRQNYLQSLVNYSLVHGGDLSGLAPSYTFKDTNILYFDEEEIPAFRI